MGLLLCCALHATPNVVRCAGLVRWYLTLSHTVAEQSSFSTSHSLFLTLITLSHILNSISLTNTLLQNSHLFSHTLSHPFSYTLSNCLRTVIFYSQHTHKLYNTFTLTQLQKIHLSLHHTLCYFLWNTFTLSLTFSRLLSLHSLSSTTVSRLSLAF